MKRPIKAGLLSAGLLIIGTVGGYFYGTYATSEVGKEVLQAVMLSDASLQATKAIEILKNLQAGNTDLVEERIESYLDFAIIEIARLYSPERDYYGVAAGALTRASEYRRAHPRSSSIDSVKRQVDAALAMKVEQKQKRESE